MSILRPHRPDVSVVVIVHNMAREAPRTLHSSSAAYQRHIAADDYEVVVIDNGSILPFDPTVLDRLAGNFPIDSHDTSAAMAGFGDQSWNCRSARELSSAS